MMKRVILFLFLGTLLTLPLAGCGKTAAPDVTPTPTPAAPSDPATGGESSTGTGDRQDPVSDGSYQADENGDVRPDGDSGTTGQDSTNGGTGDSGNTAGDTARGILDGARDAVGDMGNSVGRAARDIGNGMRQSMR